MTDQQNPNPSTEEETPHVDMFPLAMVPRFLGDESCDRLGNARNLVAVAISALGEDDEDPKRDAGIRQVLDIVDGLIAMEDERVEFPDTPDRKRLRKMAADLRANGGGVQ